MEVDKVSFYPLLLDILTDISEAHFVAIDLELSGVPSKQAKSSSGSGKQTLQQRYIETKEAAERYQILQIGLTCVTQDIVSQKYVLKPYNFEVSPLIEERGLDVERIFSVQSGAVDFLLKVGFDMSVPFKKGIPYLSRAESKEARDRFATRQDKTAISDIQIKPTETESLAFLERVRTEVKAWMTNRHPEKLDYINIGKAGAELDLDSEEPPEELSRFEKRLVHQLVRSEFPELVTISKRGFIQVVRFNKEREDKISAQRKLELEEKIARQKGFRWVVEALQGNSLTGIDLKQCARDPQTGESIFVDMDEMKSQFNRAQGLINGNPRRLIGHNCFLDLVYVYQTFIGALPDSVEEFQRKLHKLWPVVIDTKYMSTHKCGDIPPTSSLDQISHQLSFEDTPVVEVDKEHKKYENVEAFHEAGYDSFLTAQIAVRLSAKLEREGAYVEIARSNDADANISNNIAGMKLAEATPDQKAEIQANGSLAAPESNGFTPSVVGGKWKRQGDPTLGASHADDVFTYNPRDLHHRHQRPSDETFEGGMPRFGSDFWRVYGNKLRVFGTQEAVCILDGRVDSPIEENGDGGVSLDIA